MEVISYIIIAALACFMLSCALMSGYVVCRMYRDAEEEEPPQPQAEMSVPIAYPFRFYVQGEIPATIPRNVINVEANRNNYTLPIIIEKIQIIQEDPSPTSTPYAYAVIV